MMADQQTATADPIRVDVPNLGTVEFPAGTSEDVMKKAIDQQLAQSHVSKGESVPHPIVQRLLDWLPAIGGGVGASLGAAAGLPEGGIGAIPGGIAGAMMGGAAGRTVENAINSYIGNPAPKTVAESMNSVGNAGLAQGAMEAGGGLIGRGLVAPIGNRLAAAAMQSAVKPGLKDTARALAKGVSVEDLPVVKTLLQEKVNVTPGGIAKLSRIINATNADIRSAVSSIDAPISPQSVAARTESVAQQAANQVDPNADVAAVKGVTRRFLSNPKTTTVGQIGTKTEPTGVLDASGQMGTREVPVMGRVSRPISALEAQDLKTGTYRSLSKKAYGTMQPDAIEAQKALARGLKEDIAAEAAKNGVDLTALNAREGSAISAREAIANRIASAGNRDAVSLAWLAANPTHGLLFIMERSPAVKSMLARGLYKSAAIASKIPENTLRAMVATIASSSDQPEPDQPDKGGG